MRQEPQDSSPLSPVDIELILACSAEFITIPMANNLIKKGAKPDRMHPESGKAAIHYAAALSNSTMGAEIVQLFVEKASANPDLISNHECTPLYIASFNNNNFLVRYLIGTEKVDVNYTNSMGETPLFGVMMNLNMDIATALLEAGADPDAINEDGESLFDDAEDLGLTELVELLEKYRYSNKSKSSVNLYNSGVVATMIEEINSGESPLVPQLEAMLNRDSRRILQPINHDVLDRLEDLRICFPNFTEVIEYIIEQASLALLSEKPYFAMNPLLMVGGAGIGKTRFTKEISRALGLEFANIDGGNTTGSQSLGGMDSVWKDAKPGRVCEHLRKSQNANPIIMVDEIDKMVGSNQSDPFGPLYSLLEKETAQSFSDDFYRVPFDCSYVIWFATANELSTVPGPILDRFYKIKVPEPTPEQMPQVIKSVYSDIISSNKNPWGNRFNDSLSKEVLESLKSQAPRKLKQSILTAMGLVAKKIAKEKQDLTKKIHLSPADFTDNRKNEKSAMGFSKQKSR